MWITLDQIGLTLQILGVFVVFLSQVVFGYRAWRKCGSLRKAFFAMISIIRITSDKVTDPKKLKGQTEEWLEKTYPEWWALSGYLSQDIRDSAIGLAITLAGLLIELGVSLTV